METYFRFFYQRVIFSLFLCFPFSLVAEVIKFPLVGKGQYVGFTDIKTVFPEISFRYKNLSRIGSISTPNGTILFRLGGSFYALDEKLYKLPHPVLKKDEELYFPIELVEAIFIQLIAYDVRYQFKETELWLLLPKDPNPKQDLQVKAIVLDAGHGGKDPGTSDPTGAFEKEISLAVARYTYLYLRKYYPQIRVVLTRRQDQFIELEERSRIANSLLNDTRDVIFVSFHCNASLSEKAAGFEVYYLSQSPSTETSREIALVENQYIQKQKYSVVSTILSQMLSSVTQRRSKRLAESIFQEYEKGLQGQIPARGVKKADFSVLRGSLMPAVLVEMGYLTHPKESKLLRDKEIQKKIARSVLKGIHEYSLAKDR